jgi:hypothetical protein
MTDAEYEIGGELNRALDQQIGDELESLTIDDNPPKLSEKSQAILLHDELISPYSEPPRTLWCPEYSFTAQ